MLTRIVKVGSVVFIASTVALLVWTRFESIGGVALPSWPVLPLIISSIGTLPLALTKVVRESDAKSRRNWALFAGLCAVLVGLAYVLTK